jgi:hypothetical protein
MKIRNIIVLLFISSLIIQGCNSGCNKEDNEGIAAKKFYKTSKPYVRWWWFASKIKKADVRKNLDWVKANNFGGVEIAWIYPLNRKRKAEKKYEDTTYMPRYKWLGKEWSEIVSYTKTYADSIGLGCDFTFGTGWPFGDTYTPIEDATQVYIVTDSTYNRTYGVSWEYPKQGYILNHMNKGAFERYAQRMYNAMKDAFKGSMSGLFCDSWEVETHYIWTNGFDKEFEKRFGYDITKYMKNIYSDSMSGPRYDYMKLVSDYVINEFYIPYVKKCNEMGCFSRVQCGGSPTDILTAFGSVDVPETEAMLYEPPYSRITASAACLASNKFITSETFTCMYGWPKEFHGKEQVADLKIVADALMANGVNQIYWHGMPFNPVGVDSIKFYATVHVGAKGNLSKDIPKFNLYLEKVCDYMKMGKTYSDVAVYIPQEDAWVAGEYPKELQFPWVWGQYEMRYIKAADELKGYQPLWINKYFLDRSVLKYGKLNCGDAVFSSLYIDVNYMDIDALKKILEFAKEGFPVCIKRLPKEPGKIKHAEYNSILKELTSLKNTGNDFSKVAVNKPLVEGKDLADFWCRKTDDNYYIFFAQPKSFDLHLPIKYGQSFTDKEVNVPVKINIDGKTYDVNLKFKPYQSILLKISKAGKIEFPDITYNPSIPVVKTDYTPKAF